MTGDYIQEFRVVSASSSAPINDSTFFIPSKPDKTGERIVLWRDIQSEIKNADRVRNGKVLVSFMTGDDFEELVPRRILYQPGVVLDVIVTNQDQEVAVVPESSTALSRTSVQNGVHGQSHTTRSVTSDMNHDKSLVMQSDILEREEQRILQRYSQLPAANSKENMAGLLFQNSAIDDYIMGQLGSMGAGTNNIDIYQMYTIRLMHQMLNRQVLIENRIQALMTQNYELHEYPIPRMFIVLPKPKRRKDKLTHPLTKQFRLYFLCECGDHTTGAGRGNLPNKIHLAKHEGYDLEQPSEFFERYGSYVLAIMKFIKYGAMAAEVAVPPLAMFKVVDGLDTIQKSLKMTADTIGSLVDETIKHIQDLQGNGLNGGATAAGPMKLDDIEALEGADLRQLQLYLDSKDKGRVLGDLFRIFTHEGHVKWVCMDHYKESYRKAAIRRLKEVVSANKGQFLEKNGTILIDLESAVVADQFYDALVKASGVQSLDITLEWDATLRDLRKLASAVTKANINRLNMDGYYFKGPLLDILNDGRRYNPILELMCNGRVQVMALPYFDKFFQRIDVSSMTTDSQLRKLDFSPISYTNRFFEPPRLISTTLCYSRPFKSIILKLLKCFPCLVKLRVDVSGICEAFEDLATAIPTLPALEEMVIREAGAKVTTKTFQCKIQSVKVDGLVTNNLSPDQELLLRKGHLTDLVVRLDSNDPNMSLLGDVVQWNPKLRNIDVWCASRYSQYVMDTIVSTRRRILADGGSSCLFQVRIHMGRRCRRIFETILEIQDGSIEPIITSRVSADCFENNDMVFSCAFQQYGWSITTLETNWKFDDGLASILDNVTAREKGSRIVSLSLDTFALTTVGLDCMIRVIERSHDLQHLDFVFQDLHELHQQEKLQLLLVRFGKRLNELTLEGDSANVWIPQVMALCPTRLELPKLESLFLYSNDKVLLPSDCAQWIGAMLSSSSPRKPPVSSTPWSTQLAVVSTPRNACEWGSLRTIELHIPLQSDDWELVVKALDFSTVRSLRIKSAVFSMGHFELLVDCVPANANPVKELSITIISPFIIMDASECDSQLDRLYSKAANIDVRLTDELFMMCISTRFDILKRRERRAFFDVYYEEALASEDARWLSI